MLLCAWYNPCSFSWWPFYIYHFSEQLSHCQFSVSDSNNISSFVMSCKFLYMLQHFYMQLQSSKYCIILWCLDHAYLNLFHTEMHDCFILYIYIYIFTQLENHRYILSSTIILSHFFFTQSLTMYLVTQSVFVYLCHVIDESLTEIQQSTPSELLLHTTTQNYQLSGDKQIEWSSYSVPWILNNAIFHIARLHALPIWAIASSCVINEPHLAVKKVWMLEYTGKNADSQWQYRVAWRGPAVQCIWNGYVTAILCTTLAAPIKLL